MVLMNARPPTVLVVDDDATRAGQRLSGLALYLVIVNRWPALDGRIAIMTADPDAADVRRWLQLNRCPVFRKPFRVHLLAGWLAAALRPTRRRVGEG